MKRITGVVVEAFPLNRVEFDEEFQELLEQIRTKFPTGTITLQPIYEGECIGEIFPLEIEDAA